MARERKFSRSQLFAVTVALDDDRFRALRRTPEIMQEAMISVAELWHDEFRPKHFEMGAAKKYGYARRSNAYLKSRRKRGKPPLVVSGSMRQELSSFRIGLVGRSAVRLKMHARVLNLVPLPQDSVQLRVTRSNKVSYPNLKREIKVVLPEEREVLAEHAAKLLEHGYAGAKRRAGFRARLEAAVR